MLTAGGRRRCWTRPCPRWTSLASWTAEDVEEALQAALVDGLGLKPQVAFGPVRVAVTGRTVSPPLFESIELLGGSGRWPGCGPPVPVWGRLRRMG